MDTVDIQIESCIPLNANRESLFRRLIAKVFRPSVRQATVVLVDQGFCSIANFLTGVLVARACSKAEYGLYVLGFTLLMTSMGIQTSLTGTPFTVLSQRLKPGELRLYLGSTLVQHLAVSALASVGFLVAAVVVSGTGRTNGFEDVLFALAVVSVFMLLRDFMRYVLLAQLRVWASLLMGLAANVATVGILLLAYRGGWLTAPVAYLILGGSSVLPVFFVLLSERKRIAFARDKLRKHLKKNCRFGKWLIAQAIASFFAFQIYPWGLMFFKGSESTAVYGVCVGLAAILNPLFLGLNRYLGPRAAVAASKGISQIRHEVNLCIMLLIAPLLLFLLAAIFVGEWAIVAFYGSKFLGIGHIFSVYVFSTAFVAVNIMVNAGINASGRPYIIFQSRMIGLLLSVTLGLWLVHNFGPAGAVWGLLISRALTFGYQFARFQALSSTWLKIGQHW